MPKKIQSGSKHNIRIASTELFNELRDHAMELDMTWEELQAHFLKLSRAEQSKKAKNGVKQA